MHRRALLGAIAAGFGGLAGCGRSSTPQSTARSTAPPSTTTTTPGMSTDTTTASPESVPETPTESATEGEGVSLLSVTAPSRLELGETSRYAFTVTNQGDDTRVFEPSVSVRTESSGWTVYEEWEPVELAAEAARTFEGTTPQREFLSSLAFRIDGFGRGFTVDVVERQLSMPDAYRDPYDREISLEGVSVRSVYEYNSDGYRRLVDPGDDRQWAFLTVRVINRVGDEVSAPKPAGFTLRDEDRTYHPQRLPGDGRYTPQRLPAGTGTDGWIPFMTPRNLYPGDVRGRWDASLDGGDIGVVWTP